jgi:hypothetical protein
VYDKREDDARVAPSFADIVVVRDRVVAFEIDVTQQTAHDVNPAA